MFGHRNRELQHRTAWGISELVFCTVLVYIGSGGVPVGHHATGSLPPLGGGVISGVFVAGAASAAMVSWRRHVAAGTGPPAIRGPAWGCWPQPTSWCRSRSPAP